MESKNIFEKHLGKQSRTITRSDRNKPVNSKPFYNAQIGTVKEGILWRGDVDLTIDKDSLENISNELQETLYILEERTFFDVNFTTNNMIQYSVGRVYPQTKIIFEEEK